MKTAADVTKIGTILMERFSFVAYDSVKNQFTARHPRNMKILSRAIPHNRITEYTPVIRERS